MTDFDEIAKNLRDDGLDGGFDQEQEVRQAARLAGVYWQELKAKGLSDEHAYTLTSEWVGFSFEQAQRDEDGD